MLPGLKLEWPTVTTALAVHGNERVKAGFAYFLCIIFRCHQFKKVEKQKDAASYRDSGVEKALLAEFHCLDAAAGERALR